MIAVRSIGPALVERNAPVERKFRFRCGAEPIYGAHVFQGMPAIGHKIWAVAEGYIPPETEKKTREMTSHETLCILNAGDEDAKIDITVYFADREPAGPYKVTCGARRTLHLRFNDFTDPKPVPVNTDFSSVISSSVPVVVQHTRLDSRREALALLSTIAFPVV